MIKDNRHFWNAKLNCCSCGEITRVWVNNSWACLERVRVDLKSYGFEVVKVNGVI